MKQLGAKFAVITAGRRNRSRERQRLSQRGVRVVNYLFSSG